MASDNSGLPVNFYLVTTPLPYSFHDHGERHKYCSEYGAAGPRIVELAYTSHKDIAMQAGNGKAAKPISLKKAYELIETGRLEGHSLWTTVSFVELPAAYKENIMAAHPDIKTLAPVAESE